MRYHTTGGAPKGEGMKQTKPAIPWLKRIARRKRPPGPAIPNPFGNRPEQLDFTPLTDEEMEALLTQHNRPAEDQLRLQSEMAKVRHEAWFPVTPESWRVIETIIRRQRSLLRVLAELYDAFDRHGQREKQHFLVRDALDNARERQDEIRKVLDWDASVEQDSALEDVAALKNALAWYADESNWTINGETTGYGDADAAPALEDSGQIAREALESISQNESGETS